MRHEKSLMMGGMLVASLCGGMLVWLFFGAHANAQSPAVVTTPQLNLVDGSGVLRGVLSADDGTGLTSLALYDADGRVRGVFGVGRDGAPVVRLSDATGQDRLGAWLLNEDVHLVVGDDRQRHVLISSVAGTPLLSLADGGRRRAQLHLGEDGEPSLVLFGREGQRSAAITVDSGDTPLVTLYDDGRPRLTLGVVQQAVVVNFSDASQPRLVMGVADNGRPSINFLNANGEVIQELP